MTAQLIMSDDPSADDRAAILAPLAEYNGRSAPSIRAQPLAIRLHDGGEPVPGGLWGRSAYDWLFVEFLAVPEHLRGQGYGEALMGRAEAVARERGCVGVWLDTFAFQARGFYEKLGYTVFGVIDDHPIGSARYFLSKRF